jgi:hypothetical protein
MHMERVCHAPSMAAPTSSTLCVLGTFSSSFLTYLFGLSHTLCLDVSGIRVYTCTSRAWGWIAVSSSTARPTHIHTHTRVHKYTHAYAQAHTPELALMPAEKGSFSERWGAILCVCVCLCLCLCMNVCICVCVRESVCVCLMVHGVACSALGSVCFARKVFGVD